MSARAVLPSPKPMLSVSKDSVEQMIVDMMSPQTVLKFGASGKPGFRTFTLTTDLTALTWTSKGEKKRSIEIKEMKEIRFGQRTEKFKRNNRPDLEERSFSIIYADPKNPTESLDVVTKDEPEFQMWTQALGKLIEGKVDRAAIERLRTRTAQAEAKAKAAGPASPVARDAFQGASDVYAMGWGEWGQLGVKGDQGEDGANTAAPKLIEPLLGKGITQIALGWSHSVVLLETGAVLCMGNRLGSGLTVDAFAPQPVRISEKLGVSTVACGAFHTAALTEKGAVYTWGCNLNGQLGHGDRTDYLEPRLVESLATSQMGLEINILQIVCGAFSTGALADDGCVYTWGSGQYGALGHNNTEEQLRPKAISDLKGIEITKIASGHYHMFACTRNESYGWGWNAMGQLGTDSEDAQLRPHLIEAFRGMTIEDISGGAAHSAAIVYIVKVNNHVPYAWGCNAVGQCGHGKKKRINKPTPVAELIKYKPVEVMCGAMHTLVRLDNGDVYTAGCNRFGQLGTATSSDSDEFKLVETLKGKSARLLAAGGQSSAVVTARQWVEDDVAKQCMQCKTAFTFTNRKHHCRNCGGIFCNPCSNRKIAILKYGLTEPARVCGSCYTKLGGR